MCHCITGTPPDSCAQESVPELLQLLELNVCLVSIDAMGTQVKIADTILKKSGDYLLAVKDNQPREGANKFLI